MKDPNSLSQEVKIMPEEALKIFAHNTLDVPGALFLKIKEMSFDSSEEIAQVLRDFDAESKENLIKHNEMFEEWGWVFFEGDENEIQGSFNQFIASMHVYYHLFMIAFPNDG